MATQGLGEILGLSWRWIVEQARGIPRAVPRIPAPSANRDPLRRLERVVLTDAVARRLFDDFIDHRATPRGEEEIGWMIVGLRSGSEALVQGLLPAGSMREAGVAHVEFNREAYGVAIKFLRQRHPQLDLLGVVHTHPGSLRHPSEGDWHGDSRWVGRLRGREGVFGIGTADAHAPEGFISNPSPHRQIRGPLSFCWYALAHGDRRYRTIPVGITLGDDLAAPLQKCWESLERHAIPLERLFRQQVGFTMEELELDGKSLLSARLPLVEPDRSLRILIDHDDVRWYLEEDDRLTAIRPDPGPLDANAYAIMAKLAE
jgi:proteasome lid subunit RPN8/RPN11